MAISVKGSSRLHFGLLALGSGRRSFGGAGLMIQSPGIELAARPASASQVVGPVSTSLRERVSSLLASLPDAQATVPRHGVRIELTRAGPEHVGLGTGTQLSLAVTAAVHRLAGQSPSVLELAQVTGRGQRSAIGVHGFANGGFLVEGGKTADTQIAPLVARAHFPPEWPILLIQPDCPLGLHGELEERVLAGRTAIPADTTDRLCRVVLLGLLPALLESDYRVFGEALYEYNHGVGQCFASIQGGPYAHPRLTGTVQTLRGWNIPAVGQSSWGPTLFAILPDAGQAHWTAERLRQQLLLEGDRVTITRAANTGAQICEEHAGD